MGSEPRYYIILFIFTAVFFTYLVRSSVVHLSDVTHKLQSSDQNWTTFNNAVEYREHHFTTNKSSCVVILKQQLGRLGNLMFKFASAYGLARHHHCKLYVDEDYLKALNTVFTINISHMSISKLEYANLTGITFRSNVACHYLEDLVAPNSIQYLEIVGYWQAFGHFINYTDEIRQQFTFKSEIIQQISTFFLQQIRLPRSNTSKCMIQQKTKTTISGRDINITNQLDLKNHLRNSSFTFVGVHWRRGDFLNPGSKAYGHAVSSLDYLNRAMNYYLNKYCNVLFIMASDDKQYCKIVFKNNSQVMITPDNFTREQDLAALTVCQHAIVTTGTFGWFAAYLSSGDVLYDRLDLSQNTSLAKDCPRKNYYPPQFVPMK